MTEKNIEQIVREERAQNRAQPRPRRPLHRLAQLLAVLAVVLAMVVAAAWWDMGSERDLKNLLNYGKTDDAGETWRYVGAGSNRYALLGDDRLIVLSPTRLAVLANDGTEVYARALDWSAPCIAPGGATAAVYDAGGSELLLLDRQGLARDMSGEVSGALFSVRLGAHGEVCTAGEKSGYRSAVTVFGATGEKLYEINSSNRYMMDACVSTDGKTLAVAVPGEAEGAFETTVLLYRMDEEASFASWSMSDSVALALEATEEGFVTVGDDRVTVVSDEGALVGAYRYEYDYLRGTAPDGEGFFALYLSQYRSGNAGMLVTLNADGTKRAAMELRGEVLDISACGPYVCVLGADSLTVYTAELEEYAALEDTGYARGALQRADGSVVLLGSSEAGVFAP